MPESRNVRYGSAKIQIPIVLRHRIVDPGGYGRARAYDIAFSQSFPCIQSFDTHDFLAVVGHKGQFQGGFRLNFPERPVDLRFGGCRQRFGARQE